MQKKVAQGRSYTRKSRAGPREPSLDKMGKEVVERFGQRRMSENAFPQGSESQTAHHRHFQHGHDFAALNPQNGGPEDLTALSVHDGLHEAAAFINFERAGDILHGHFADEYFFVLLGRLPFRYAYAPSLP